jgi:hypothetical protein
MLSTAQTEQFGNFLAAERGEQLVSGAVGVKISSYEADS